ncbi:hypothetical protein CHELA1G11_10095 [Hyphomicrobiales bacterium]|nr:hypothetical protein CHELA1G11_10095 [Hyphomicrobiales bacterium]CAH1677113.1 hypothetical protein CHELA1G2_14215 [Hyphomicrobiales bacterium]
MLLPGRRRPEMHRCEQFNLIYFEERQFILMQGDFMCGSMLACVVCGNGRGRRWGNGKAVDHQRRGTAERGRSDRGRHAGTGGTATETRAGDRRPSRLVRSGSSSRPGME